MPLRTFEQNIRLHALLQQLQIPLEYKSSLAYQFSNNRTGSTKELYDYECEQLNRELQRRWDLLTLKTRNAILHYMALLGYEYNGKPDYRRIDEFIKNIGARNPKKKALNALDRKELNEVCTQIKAMYEHEMKRISTNKQ
jgi:hypothetical protein